MSKTVNRGWLRKQVEKGNMEVKCCYHMTDDYRYDYDNNCGKTGWFQACLDDGKGQTVGELFKLPERYFKSVSGCAYESNGVISLIVHSNLAFELRKVEVA